MTDNLTPMNMTPQEMEAIMTLLGADYLNEDSVKEKNKAWLAPVAYDDGGHPVVITDARYYGNDLYDLISDEGTTLAKDYDQLLVYTCGWASPVTGSDSDELPPSVHPDRIRVGLLCLTTKNGLVGSALRKGSDDEIIVTTDGRGALAEALMSVWE